MLKSCSKDSGGVEYPVTPSRLNEYLNMTGTKANITFKLDYANLSAPVTKTIYEIASSAFKVSPAVPVKTVGIDMVP